MSQNDYDVIVVGAGAAGLMAAKRAANRGLTTLLLEKNRKVGVKILMSGGTRCNLTHDNTPAEIAKAYEQLVGGKSGKTKARFLRSALSHLTPEQLIDLFHAEGVQTKVEETGKVFPVSNRSVDVQQALLRMFKASGAILAKEEAVVSLVKQEECFVVTTNQQTLNAKKLIITVGGRSYPGCGTTGDGYAWAKAFGHSIVPPRPALVPLTADMEASCAWMRPLQGLTLPDVKIQIRNANREIVCTRRSSFLFTHFGISGPVAMDASRFVTESPSAGWIAECDFLPYLTEQQFREELIGKAADHGKRGIVGFLSDKLPRSLVEELLQLASVPEDRRLAELRKDERSAILQSVKANPVLLRGSLGFKKAEVTAGGVDLSEIDSKTMQSRIVDGLYFAGEVLDLDGPIGGYNFQAAFSTGALAGDSV